MISQYLTSQPPSIREAAANAARELRELTPKQAVYLTRAKNETNLGDEK